METKTVLFRLGDLALILALAFGAPTLQTFAAVLVWCMAALNVFGVFAMDAKLAAAPVFSQPWKARINWVITLGYVVAALLANRPALAACFILSRGLLHLRAEQVLEQQEAKQ